MYILTRYKPTRFPGAAAVVQMHATASATECGRYSGNTIVRSILLRSSFTELSHVMIPLNNTRVNATTLWRRSPKKLEASLGRSLHVCTNNSLPKSAQHLIVSVLNLSRVSFQDRGEVPDIPDTSLVHPWTSSVTESSIALESLPPTSFLEEHTSLPNPFPSGYTWSIFG